MARGFCNGCKHWIWCETEPYSPGFHYCKVLDTDSLRERKFLCNGKFKKEKR